MDHAELAWSLVHAANHRLEPDERAGIYVPLGAGDTDTAIIRLIWVVVREYLSLPADVVRSLVLWRKAQAPPTAAAVAPLIASMKVHAEDPPTGPQRATAARRHRPVRRRNSASG